MIDGSAPDARPTEPGAVPAGPDDDPQDVRSATDRGPLLGLALAAFGVVFGDIGTSPLYAVQTVFSIDDHAVRPSPSDVYGVVSLIFWSVTLVVTIKYVTLVLRADNDGEGGIMALAALVHTVLSRISPHRAGIALGLGVLGASLFYATR